METTDHADTARAPAAAGPTPPGDARGRLTEPSGPRDRGVPRAIALLRDLGFLVLAALAVVAYDAALARYAMDDAFITFRYADNLAAGRGFVFNPGERVLGTSTPLTTLLLALLKLLGCDIVATAGLLYCLCLGLVAVGGWWLLRRLGSPNLAVLFGVLVLWGVGDSLAYYGMETTLYAALMMWALVAAVTRRELLAGIGAGLATLARYDGALFAATLVLLLWIRSRRIPWKAAVAAAVVVAPWLVFAWLYFGSPLPNTLGAKSGTVGVLDSLQASLTQSVDGLFAPLVRFGWQWMPHPVIRWATALALIAPLFGHTRETVRREPLAAAMLLYPLLLWFGYAVIGPPVEHSWYMLPGRYFALLHCLVVWGRTATPGPVPRAMAATAAFALVAASLVVGPAACRAEASRLIDSQLHRSRVGSYGPLAGWITANGLEDLVVLTYEPGYFAYHSHSPVVDAAGLVTPGVYFHGPSERQTPIDATIERFRPGLVLLPLGWRRADSPDYLPIQYTRFSNSLYIRRDVFLDRLAALAAPWLATGPASPAPADALRHPIHFDFEPGAGHGWSTSWYSGGFVGRPVEASLDGEPWPGSYLTTHGLDGPGLLASPPFVIDFDELSFAFAGTDRRTRAELLVNGLPVLTTEGRAGARPVMERVVWPVASWRGKVAVLRFVDEAPGAGFLVADDVRSERGRDRVLFDDFESGTWSDRWRETFADRPAGALDLAVDGINLIQGRSSAVSAPEPGERRLRSRPFTVERDRMAFVVFDLGGSRTAVELAVGGRVVRRFGGRRSGSLAGVVWDVAELRGTAAELAVIDGAPAAVNRVGIDGIVLYDAERSGPATRATSRSEPGAE